MQHTHVTTRHGSTSREVRQESSQSPALRPGRCRVLDTPVDAGTPCPGIQATGHPGTQAIGPIQVAAVADGTLAAQHLGSPGLSDTRSRNQRWHGPAWPSMGMGMGIAIIGALPYMGAGPEGALQLQLPAFVPPPAWHLAAPRLGDTATLRPHTLWRTGGLGASSSQQAGRTKIPSLQLALPSISGHSFLIPARPQPNRKDRGPWPTTSPSCHSTTVQALPSEAFAGRDGSGASASCWSSVDVRTHVCPFARRGQATPQRSPGFAIRSSAWGPHMPKAQPLLPVSA